VGGAPEGECGGCEEESEEEGDEAGRVGSHGRVATLVAIALRLRTVKVEGIEFLVGFWIEGNVI
jgi:hypothetical protein